MAKLQPKPRGYGNYLLFQLILVGISLAAAFIGGLWLYSNIPFLPIFIGQAFGSLYAPLNDPFWVSTFLVYALIFLVISFIRFKTGSRI